MGYVKKTLGPNEKYIYRAKFNWTYDFVGWFWLTVGSLPMILWLYSQSTGAYDATAFGGFLIAGVLGLLTGALIWLVRNIHKWTTVIAVTSARVILKRGFISRKSQDISLQQIEKVNVRQSFFGRICGFGTLLIRGAGDAVMEIPPVDKPLILRREIRQAKSQVQTETGRH